jgi:AraC-like DNA-binding protein
MRIARSGESWRLVAVGRVIHDCLASLAFAEGYRVSAVCGKLGLSSPYFREIFVRDVGMSPKAWMQEERMVVARQLLGEGMEPQVISEMLGFSHPNSFRREFRETHGLSPTKFIETQRESGGWAGGETS